MCIRDRYQRRVHGEDKRKRSQRHQYVSNLLIHAMAQPDITIGYWAIRGLGAPIRLLLEYVGLPYNDRRYTGEDRETWFKTDKPALKTNFPNLPYLKDGDYALTESDAILQYICLRAGKPELCRRDDPKEQGKLYEVFGVVTDTKREFYSLCYNPNYDTEREGIYKNKIQPNLTKLNTLLANQDYLVGTISFVDIVLYELLDVINLQEAAQLDAHENLRKFHARIGALPPIAAYLASPRFIARPVNNPLFAKWAQFRSISIKLPISIYFCVRISQVCLIMFFFDNERTMSESGLLLITSEMGGVSNEIPPLFIFGQG
eukprot:TRINITY_DN1334_c0_g1_i1.p1 TRINITY_DN1334_c0_g1~~TRINITY_DN1334_c0_g1_i1.p1  ORF type:complete len:317 (+),score=99.84 TRINITY_DN1334_c0_g1_i1:110-1060(+)